jgi:hypothetical protein
LSLLVEFLRNDDPEARSFTAEVIGYLIGYAHLTNTRSLALRADPDNSVYELLFSFSSPAEKIRFLDLVRSTDDLGNDYIENDFLSPTTDEIRAASPLAAVLPNDVLAHVALIAASICANASYQIPN